MIAQCAAPDPNLGVALRVASYLDCQGRTLGENGFQALAGGPAMAATLSGLVAIFIALIGYRMVLGTVPTMRDGVSWAVRLGIVFALVTGWSAFNTLIYRVATNSPEEFAAVLLPAAGLPSSGIETRVQQAYDAMRLGRGNSADGEALPGQGEALLQPNALNSASSPELRQPAFQPLPQSASLLVVSTVGLAGTMRLVVGFLLAIAPLALITLLFDGTSGIFSGWLRALIGAALAVLASSISSAVEMAVVESELTRASQIAPFSPDNDPQALVTIVILFFVLAIGLAIAAFRVGGAFRLPAFGSSIDQRSTDRGWTTSSFAAASSSTQIEGRVMSRTALGRADVVAEALVNAAHRDSQLFNSGSVPPSSRLLGRTVEPSHGESPSSSRITSSGRRVQHRRSLRAASRDAQR